MAISDAVTNTTITPRTRRGVKERERRRKDEYADSRNQTKQHDEGAFDSNFEGC
jgi:hypothetical protein